MGKALLITLFLIQTLFVNGQEHAPEPPDGFRSMTTLKIAYVFGRLKLVEENPAVPDDLTFYKNTIYWVVNNDTITMDICHSEGIKETAPLLIFIYGEAWKRGDKDNYKGYLIDFAKRGYITASINYRNSKIAPFPAALMDVKYAVKWLKSNEEVIETTSADRFIGKPFSTNPEAYKEASPITYVSEGNPPTLIFHGTINDVVPVEESEILKQKMEANGVAVEYHRLKGWPHFMEAGKKINVYCQYYMNQFFNKYFKDK